MKEQILKLRSEGKSYSEIQKELKCSKSTISYHCGENQKTKNNERVKIRRSKNSLLQKVDAFQRKNIYNKVRDFQKPDKRFNVNDVIDRFGENPKCYLTGRKINLLNPSSYHFDHIIPRKLGGNASIENLGIVCKEANMSKSDLSFEEYLSLCKEVLENNGYKVLK